MEHPSQIGKYEVIAVAGEGNMGTVYEGHDPFTDTRVAIKLCPVTEGSGFKLARKMFFNEAHTAGALEHPNILSIRDAGEHEGHPYIVMEYVDGGETLRSRISPENLLPVSRTVEILYQCAKALDYAHRRGVIHRDIKPSNIMMTANGTPKIGDFGIAQHAFSDETQVMGMLGSPRYMSPEQTQEEDLTRHTDLYSLGVVAYELLTGQPPFLARNITQLVQKIGAEPPRPMTELRDDLPPELVAIVDRAMSKKPQDRFDSGQDMASELATVLGRLEHPTAIAEPEDALKCLRGMNFFNDFSDTEVEQVMITGSWQQVGAGGQILSEGRVADSVYLLVRGRASVQMHNREVGVVETGECFGEMAQFNQGERCASVIALEECRMLCIDDRLIEHAPLECQLRLARALQRVLAQRLQRGNERLLAQMQAA
jgi:serine/threonine protein kinase